MSITYEVTNGNDIVGHGKEFEIAYGGVLIVTGINGKRFALAPGQWTCIEEEDE